MQRPHHIETAAALARTLIAPRSDASAKDIAARAGHAASLFSQHLSRIVGDIGIKSLVRRSILVAGQTYPWLTNIGRGAEADPCTAMRAVMEHQQAEEAAGGFVLVWTSFVGLLDELIGMKLVEHLLHEIWPTHVPEPAAVHPPT